MTKMHPRAPWGDVAFAGAYWNCAERLEKLLAYVRPWFKHIVVGVQESPDNTLEVARRYADLVVEDQWHGRGDPTLNKVIRQAGKKYAFVISDDEWPTEALLNSFQDAVEAMIRGSRHGAWVHFKSTIDGFDFTREQDEHLRLFEPRFGWPSMPHARPPIDNGLRWRPSPEAFVRHDRSLDEMMQDYIRRYDLTAKEPSWVQQQAHNVRMMQGACNAIMERRGTEYVTFFDWWPRVLEVVYKGDAPAHIADPTASEAVEEPTSSPKPAPKKRRKRKAATKRSSTRKSE